MQNRIAIFGLTGDPFTIAHRDICKQAIDTLQLQKLYVIPTVVEYHRKGKKRWLTDQQRLTCAEEMLWSLGPRYGKKIELDDSELILKSLCFANPPLDEEVVKRRRFIHTLLDFKVRNRINGDTSLYMIIGEDELKIFQTWHEWESILDNIDCLAVVKGHNGGEDVHVPSEIMHRMHRRVEELELSQSYLYGVSASAVREYHDNLDSYLDYVKQIDSHEVDWITVPWIEKKRREA
ncbi:MAG: hypothetical protein J6Q22_10640 [Prevotella sp.]|nr:hypothetical protein [Prevotella sp.]